MEKTKRMWFFDFYAMKIKLIPLLFSTILFISCVEHTISETADPDPASVHLPWNVDAPFDSETEHDMGNIANDYTLGYTPPYIDKLEYDDYEEYDLDYLLEYSRKPLAARERALNDKQRLELRDINNKYRSNLTGPLPSGSDMDFMEYDPMMERTADVWADRCLFEHGRPKSNFTKRYQQNLYIGSSGLISRAMYLWYMEWKFWNFKTESCPGEGPPGSAVQCGHFLVLMWSVTNKMGCSTSFCFPRKGGFLTVCHYYPPGNRRGPKAELYTHWNYGLPCSRCKQSVEEKRTGESLCWKNLCVTKEKCVKNKLKGCKCKLKCKNCGVLDRKKCICKCKDGWDRSSCSEPCVNNVPIKTFPKPCTSFPKKRLCSIAKYDYAIRLAYCRNFCGTCKGINPKNLKAACCKAKMCKLGYEFDKKCKCVPICPGPICKFGIPPKTELI